MHYKDCPDTPPPGMVPPGSENKVMHACFKIGETSVMASDGHCPGHPSFHGFSLSDHGAERGGGGSQVQRLGRAAR